MRLCSESKVIIGIPTLAELGILKQTKKFGQLVALEPSTDDFRSSLGQFTSTAVSYLINSRNPKIWILVYTSLDALWPGEYTHIFVW